MFHIHAPAKVNLHLAVGPLQPDGYHPVDTVLHALEFGDEVTVGPAERLRFSCVPGLGLADDDNLAHKAVLAMAERFHRAWAGRAQTPQP
jgi:4-diphosphocytidyl-2-C-methyl-D-erythritol kinase